MEIRQHLSESDEFIMKKWDEFTDVPFDESTTPSGFVLAEDWWVFKKGTDRKDIWRFFDRAYSRGVASLLYGDHEEKQ